MELNLVVIKTHNIHKSAEFYSLLGLKFEYHKHEKGEFHYSAEINEIVFEIYPLSENQSADKSTRLGFKTENLFEIIQLLESQNHKIVSYPKETDYGLVSVVEDLDGRKIELTQSN